MITNLEILLTFLKLKQSLVVVTLICVEHSVASLADIYSIFEVYLSLRLIFKSVFE